MDREISDLAPPSLGDIEVNTVKRPSSDNADDAASEKEKKEDYYVDPIDQEDIMKDKLEKIEAEREERRRQAAEEAGETASVVDTTLKPDMNVTGFFSAGNTATKTGLLNSSASSGTLSVSMIFGIISGIYSAFYLVILIAGNYATEHWFAGWLYVVIAIMALFSLFTGIRSLKVKNDALKRKALIGIVGAVITVFPFIALVIHWISQSM